MEPITLLPPIHGAANPCVHQSGYAPNLPSTDWGRNSAWLQLAALACTLNAWLRHLALHGPLAKAEPKKLRYRLLGGPAKHIVHARQPTLLIPPGWKWANDLATGWERLQALHPI